MMVGVEFVEPSKSSFQDSSYGCRWMRLARILWQSFWSAEDPSGLRPRNAPSRPQGGEGKGTTFCITFCIILHNFCIIAISLCKSLGGPSEGSEPSHFLPPIFHNHYAKVMQKLCKSYAKVMQSYAKLCKVMQSKNMLSTKNEDRITCLMLEGGPRCSCSRLRRCDGGSLDFQGRHAPNRLR